MLIVWGGALRPEAAGRATAVLFVALTAGQALGAVGTGALVTLVAAVVLACSAAVLPRRPAGA